VGSWKGMLTPLKGGSGSAKEKDNTKRLARCGKCTNCKSQDCGNCYNCADKPKFGGPGIKKQACVNRKCLLMVPRDEDGEKLARKRAKQRAVPPQIQRLPMATGADAVFLPALAIELPSSPAPTRSSATSLPSPRSGTSSPTSPLNRFVDIEADPHASLPEGATRDQALSEESLFELALGEEGRGRSLSSAMLFATIQTPNASPQRSHQPPDSRHDRGSSASPSPLPSPTSARSKRNAPPVTIDLDEEADDVELKAAFVAHIAAKLELDTPPPSQPPLDECELHEEFMLLNAEHRRLPEVAMAF